MKKAFSLFILFFSTFLVFPQSTILEYSGSENYILTERTDLRRYDNNKYTGLLSREVKSFIVPTYSNGAKLYEGDFYVEQDTKRSAIALDEGIHDSILSIFSINEQGEMEMFEDNGYPSFRSFPSYPQKEIKKGDIWSAKAERAVDPTGEGKITRMPIYVQYTYSGDQIFNEREVYLIKAQWATRYGTNTKYIDLDGDPELITASGKHDAVIYLDKETGAALLIRDQVDELFTYKSGNKIAYKGTISLFTEYPSAVDTQEIMPVINRLVQETDIDYKDTDAGLMLVINDLQFYANSPELLPDEKERLDQIASLLKKVPKNQILIEGHTARVGDESDEMGLSLERAHTIVKELTARGVPKDKFITKGSGGTKPVADNDTPEGRARNRRVEITILTNKRN
ncbi:MAG: OmpA family protein [Treponema sp.]|nr:OmpA family protein [Treponema sp.]